MDAPRTPERVRVQFTARYSPQSGGLLNAGEGAALPSAEAADVVQRGIARLDPVLPVNPLPPEDKAMSHAPAHKMIEQSEQKGRR